MASKNIHRSYQSILPTSNKLLQQKWDQKYYEEHRRMVRDVAPMVDTKAPQTYMHLHLKLKKLQLEEERLATIERDNRILLEKMSYIMRTQGRVDNRNNYEYKSLNREKRQRELLRVTRENQTILKRITIRQPEYDHVRWQQEWEQNLQFMDNISSFPHEWWKTPRTARGTARQESRRSQDEKDEDEEKQNGDKDDDDQNKKDDDDQNKDDDTDKNADKDADENDDGTDKDEQKEVDHDAA